MPEYSRLEHPESAIGPAMFGFGMTIFLIGLLGMVWDIFNLNWLHNYGVSMHRLMHLSDAIGTSLLGIAVWLVLRPTQNRQEVAWVNFIRYCCLLVPAGIGLFTMMLYLQLAYYNVANLVLYDYPAIETTFLTGLLLFLSSVALFVVMRYRHSTAMIVYGTGIPALLILAFCLYAFAGHLYNLPVLFSFRTPLFWSAGYILLSTALLIGTIPYGGLIHPLVSDSVKGRLLALSALIMGNLIWVLGIYTISVISEFEAEENLLAHRWLYLVFEVANILLGILVTVVTLRAIHFFIESVQLAQQKATTADEEATMRNVIEAVHSLPTLEAIFETLVNELGSFLKADRCFITAFDSATQTVLPPREEYLSSTEIESMLGDKAGLWESLGEFAAQLCHFNKSIVFDADSSHLSFEARECITKINVASGIGCTISYQGDCMAILFVHQVTSKRAWTEREIRIIESIAEQAAVAVHQAKLLERLRSSLERERLIRSISELINESYDIDIILNNAAKLVCDYFEADRTLIMKYESQDGIQNMKLATQARRSDQVKPVDESLIPIQAMEKFLGEERAQRTLTLFNYAHPENIPSFYHSYAAKFQIQSVIAVEIAYRHNYYGRLVLHQSTPRDWPAEDIQFLENVATHIGIAQYLVELYQHEQQAREVAETANSRKTKAMSALSHELKNPLNSVIGYTDLVLQGNAGDLSEKQSKFLNNVAASGRHMLQIVTDVLDIARIEAGAIEFQPEFIMIEPLVYDVKAMIQEIADQHEIRLQVDIQPDIQGARLDSLRIRQILLNLISNAIKFSKRPGDEVQLKVYKDPTKKWLYFDVIDHGVGIPPGKIDDIFTEFYQVSSPNLPTPKKEGHGLGLSLSKRLAELHGGEILVKSIFGEGSTFTLKLPVG